MERFDAKNCDQMFSTISGQSLIPHPLPCCGGLALLQTKALSCLLARPVRVVEDGTNYAPLSWQRLVRKSVRVRVVGPLSRTTKDNLLESGRLSRNAKLNTR